MPTLLRQSLFLAATAAILLAARGELARQRSGRPVRRCGWRSRSEGCWKIAVEEFQIFLEKYPKDRRADLGTFYLAESLLQSVDLPSAIAIPAISPESSPQGQYAKASLFRSGEAVYLAGDYKTARPDLEVFLKKYPAEWRDAYPRRRTWAISLAGGDAAAAAGLFGDGLKRFPNGPLQNDCRVGLARTLEKQGQRAEAERLYRAAAEPLDGAQADAARFHLGAMQYAAGKYEEAIRTFEVFDDRLAEVLGVRNATGPRLGLAEARPTRRSRTLVRPCRGERLGRRGIDSAGDSR